MTDAVYPVPDEWARKALINADRYTAMYRESVEDPEGFWRREALRIDWMLPFSRIKETSFHEVDFGINWFADGTLNLSANCLDRHLAERCDVTAIIWEPDDPAEEGRSISYAELHGMVCRFANALKANGVEPGDRVTIYMPMVPEAAVAMLACARIGAIHSVVFGGFAASELATRISDARPKLIISASCGIEVNRVVAYKPLLDQAIEIASAKPEQCVILQRPQETASMVPGRDLD